ncbi:MAG: hypothetical protein Q9219_000207 [cf. Caloplaca sp. 3 TL-2023]
MSSTTVSDLPNDPIVGLKKKKSKRKKSGARGKGNGNPLKDNDTDQDKNDGKQEREAEGEDEGEELIGPGSEAVLASNDQSATGSKRVPNGRTDSNELSPDGENAQHSRALNQKTEGTKDEETGIDEHSVPLGNNLSSNTVLGSNPNMSSNDTEAKMEIMAQERESLMMQIAELRRSFEQVQEKYEKDMKIIHGQLEERQIEKETAETQYRNLLGKVNTIRSQLGERLKADAVGSIIHLEGNKTLTLLKDDLSQARGRIEELEEQCDILRTENETRTAELATATEEGEQRSRELSTLRNRTTLSQQNWVKEREDLQKKEATAREEFEAARQAMQDWEVLAMEERSIREGIAERVLDLEEQISARRVAYESAVSERDSHSLTVDGLQRALQEIQDARRKELRSLVENSEAQVGNLRKQLRESQQQGSEAKHRLEATHQELERALPFEKEVKEKNLLIGKLRHEAVILNDHLTKALRYLKKGKPEENIDKSVSQLSSARAISDNISDN